MQEFNCQKNYWHVLFKLKLAISQCCSFTLKYLLLVPQLPPTHITVIKFKYWKIYATFLNEFRGSSLRNIRLIISPSNVFPREILINTYWASPGSNNEGSLTAYSNYVGKTLNCVNCHLLWRVHCQFHYRFLRDSGKILFQIRIQMFWVGCHSLYICSALLQSDLAP